MLADGCRLLDIWCSCLYTTDSLDDGPFFLWAKHDRPFFFCDGPPVLKLVTQDTTMYEMQALASPLLFIMLPFSLILVYNIRIISTILRMPSATGHLKAFSTCISHIIVVSLFYGTASLTYLQPKSNQSLESKKLLSLSYTVITPMLNPIIYSLRNNELKGRIKRTFTRKVL